MTDYHKLAVFLSDVAVMLHIDSEGMRINYVDTDIDLVDGLPVVHATGEESGEEYSIPINEIDVENTLFYKFQQIEFKD
jgi:hypothetical protein